MELGSGNQGDVTRVNMEGEELAIKSFGTFDEIYDGRSFGRIFRENSVLIKLEHPNIIKGYGLYIEPEEEDEKVKLKMELADYDLSKSFPDDTIRLMHELISALHFAHQNNYLHDDIKLENILMIGNSAKIGDWGNSQLIDSPYEYVGQSMYYTSINGMLLKEMVRKKDLKKEFNVTLESVQNETRIQRDIYSLGITFMAICSKNSNLSQVFGEANMNEYKFLRDITANSPDIVADKLMLTWGIQTDFAGVIGKMITAYPKYRYQNVIEILNEDLFHLYNKPIPGAYITNKPQCGKLSSFEWKEFLEMCSTYHEFILGLEYASIYDLDIDEISYIINAHYDNTEEDYNLDRKTIELIIDKEILLVDDYYTKFIYKNQYFSLLYFLLSPELVGWDIDVFLARSNREDFLIENCEDIDFKSQIHESFEKCLEDILNLVWDI